MLIPPNEVRRTWWRARFQDPDSGRTVWQSLDRALSTVELREDWAVRKSKALGKRRLELESGAARATGTAFNDAIEGYFRAHPELRKKTLLGYRAAARKLLTWATKTGLRSADDLTRSRLMNFREGLVNEPKRTAARGGKRGARQEAPERRSAHSLNRDLRAARTILGYLCDADLLPRCTHDDLRRALKRQAAPIERIEYLKPNELRALLKAALKHDAETFEATRAEHAGLLPPGSTPRYEPIAPFVACAVLTGMRLGEVLSLEWRQVELDGEGAIHLTGATKTKRARTLGLDVSPALRTMLEGMRPEHAQGSVFKHTEGTTKAAAKRLLADYGAPGSFTWQALRRTCGTFLTNAPGIFGAASAYRSAKQLGHSVAVAERHYVGVVRGIPPEARTLEAAMQIEAPLEEIIARM